SSNRARDHPGLVMYSIGNEIRDAIGSMMTTATNLVAVSHMVDPTRPVTQALFRPLDGGAFPASGTGGMLGILDVYGANYRIAEVLTAMAFTPHHAGVLTEDGSGSTSNWGMITANPGMT